MLSPISKMSPHLLYLTIDQINAQLDLTEKSKIHKLIGRIPTYSDAIKFF
jgi:hypothetical protein